MASAAGEDRRDSGPGGEQESFVSFMEWIGPDECEQQAYDIQLHPVRDEGGNFAGVAYVCRNATLRVRAEQALNESEERFRMTADALPIMLWVEDPDGRQVFANLGYREYFGVATTDGSKEGGYDALLHPDDRVRYARSRVEAYGRRQPFQAETQARAADGRWRWVEVCLSPRFSVRREFLGFVGLARDVTERHVMQESLSEVNRQKDRFLATLSHELRNPLTPLRSAIDILGRTPRANAAEENLLSIAARQLDHVTRLVDDPSDISRINRGKFSLHRNPLNVKDVIRTATEMCHSLLDVSRCDLVEDIEPSDMVVNGDAVRLAQVISNLLTNAARHGGIDGYIWLSAREKDGYARISVRDEGKGIDPESLPHIFEAFTQGAYSASGGMGLGLALARSFVELHGGIIEAYSEGLGSGSEFVVRLPLLSPASGTTSQLPSPENETNARRPEAD